MKKNIVKIKCGCCKDTLEIYCGQGQTIFSIELDKWRLLGRIKYAFGIIFRPSVYKYGGTLWIEPKRFKKYLKRLEKLNDEAIKKGEEWDKENL